MYNRKRRRRRRQWRMKKRSRVGGRMEKEKDRSSSRRWYRSGWTQSRWTQLWIAMGSLAAFLLWPRCCIQGSRWTSRGQPKLRQSGQARPAKPGERQVRRVSRALIPAGYEPPRQSGAARSSRNQYRGERLAEVAQHRLQASEPRDQPPVLPAPLSISLSIFLQQSHHHLGPGP